MFKNLINKFLCSHNYKLEKIINLTVDGTERTKYGEKRTFLCTKCLKVKRVRTW